MIGLLRQAIAKGSVSALTLMRVFRTPRRPRKGLCVVSRPAPATVLSAMLTRASIRTCHETLTTATEASRRVRKRFFLEKMARFFSSIR